MDVEYTEAFLRQLRWLGRRYRHIRDDVQPVIEQLQAGETLGGPRFPMLALPFLKSGFATATSRKAKARVIG